MRHTWPPAPRRNIAKGWARGRAPARVAAERTSHARSYMRSILHWGSGGALASPLGRWSWSRLWEVNSGPGGLHSASLSVDAAMPGPMPVRAARASRHVPHARTIFSEGDTAAAGGGGDGRGAPAAAVRHGAACAPSWPSLCHGDSMQRPSMNESSHGRGTRTTDLNLRVACIRPSAHAASGRGQQAGGRAPADAYTVPTGCTHRACNETPTILQSSYSQHTVSITVSVKNAWFSDSQH